MGGFSKKKQIIADSFQLDKMNVQNKIYSAIKGHTLNFVKELAMCILHCSMNRCINKVQGMMKVKAYNLQLQIDVKKL